MHPSERTTDGRARRHTGLVRDIAHANDAVVAGDVGWVEVQRVARLRSVR